ncbi:hypothetical protein P692DRAFT_20871084 [Suillus brevipes Sb2]|nr:hypothetical protein P692DRAFT_20871084 [Suillus brevipes Sb2]
MPPRKRARQGSPGDSLRKGAKVARADADATRRSSRSMRGIGGHAAQLQKTGETLMAPSRHKKADNLNISDSEENPMAPSQLKRHKEKVAASTPKTSVEPDSSRPESERACLHIARPSDRFGFKPSQSQATHPVGHNHKEAGSDIAEQDLENCSGSGDLDDFDEEYDDGPALTDSPPGGDASLDAMMGAQIQSLIAPLNSRGHTLTSNAFGRSKSPHQYSPKHIPHRRSPETRTSSTRLKPPQRAPRKGPSAKAGSAHGPTPESRNRDKPMNKQTNPSKLGFYPPCWQAFLQATKLEMRLQAVLTHPVPEHQHALQLAREVLDAVLWSHHSKKIKMENGYFPQYRAQMSRLLCDDLFTFHTKLKKIIISIAKQLYGIFPKANMGQKDALQWQVGKYKNFVSQVLKDACINFFYSNGKKALKLTKEFHKTIPVNPLILVSTAKGILTGFRDTGTDKVPDLSVNTLMDNSERRQELESMLEEWADVGMMGEFRDDSDSAAGSDDVNIIL